MVIGPVAILCGSSHTTAHNNVWAAVLLRYHDAGQHDAPPSSFSLFFSDNVLPKLGSRASLYLQSKMDIGGGQSYL